MFQRVDRFSRRAAPTAELREKGIAVNAVRVGSIGLGSWGRRLADAAPQAGLIVETCFSRTETARAEFALRYRCRASSSLEELLEDERIEAVLVATPHSTHSELIEAASSAGKHVFVEKPLDVDYARAARAVAGAKAAGIILQVGHNRRRQPANRRIKQMIEDGMLGAIHLVEAQKSAPRGLRPGRAGWRVDPSESPLGGMTGHGVHMLDTLQYLLGPARRVSALSKRTMGLAPRDDVTTLILEYEAGPLAYVGTSLVVPDACWIAVRGSSGAAFNEADGDRLAFQALGEEAPATQPVETIDTIVDELAEFAAVVTAGGKPETGGAEGLEVVAILVAAVESVSSGRVVSVDDVRRLG